MLTKLLTSIKNNLGFIVMLLLLFSVRSSLADWYHIPSGSMLPSVEIGDRVLVDKTAYRIEVPFTEGLVKEMLYKPIIKAMYQKTSTTKLTGRELSEAAEVLVRWLSEKKGIYVPFPQSIKDEL